MIQRRQCTEEEFHKGEHCDQCCHSRSEWDDQIYVCNLDDIQVSDLDTCIHFNDPEINPGS